MTDKIDKKVKRIKTWTYKVTEYDDNTSLLERTNEGFNAHELLGLIEETKDDIIQQMRGNIKPDSIKRNFIEA
jgi:hypothetical protein